jgi:hypothetical protein
MKMEIRPKFFSNYYGIKQEVSSRRKGGNFTKYSNLKHFKLLMGQQRN